MKFARFTCQADKTIRLGVVADQYIQEIDGELFGGGWSFTGKKFVLDQVSFLAPLVPNQIIGIGANFVATKEELPAKLPDIPVFFYKPVSSVIGPEDEIIIPAKIDNVKFEAELAVIVGKQMHQVEEADVLDYIFGYTIGNDITAPQYFHPNGHWMVGKSFDTFTPLGPVIETELDPFKAKIQAYHNGCLKQESETDLMIVSVSKMVAYLSNVLTLRPGDVILTGSPVGADFLEDGDSIECCIEGIGVLRNRAIK